MQFLFVKRHGTVPLTRCCQSSYLCSDYKPTRPLIPTLLIGVVAIIQLLSCSLCVNFYVMYTLNTVTTRNVNSETYFRMRQCHTDIYTLYK